MIVVIDYGMGNLRSVQKAFNRIGCNAVISSSETDILNAGKLILPGVGHFKMGMEKLKEAGLVNLLNKKIIEDKIPVLGICLGMQLMTKFSEEGNIEGLGWIDAQTLRFKAENKNIKIPHMGWNSLSVKENILFNGLKNDDTFYFVHSYYVKCNKQENVLSTTNYGIEFHSGISSENITGVQFHPEKSHSKGLLLLKNFIDN
jgi:imidazole glycerol-phosphate synthase subunit HisH